ncbi:hypothetical protein N7451_003261 [Penicillium sp. IBT 35674x]|nr:hypothetical protein N7451_003261 [Penicillium sp. IBT 35674x]
MKASIILMAASAGIALTHPTTLTERTSSVCPSPGAPVAACCFSMPWTSEHYPYTVCLKASNYSTTAEFEETCLATGKLHPKAQCCPEFMIGTDENDNSHGDLLCRNPSTVQ